MTQPVSSAPGQSRAVDDLVVLEVSTGVSAAYCGRLLAMYGARVVLLEPPGGSELRSIGPFGSSDRPRESGALFLTLAAGKQSIELDLASPSGRASFDELASRADILLTDDAAGLAVAGIDYESLARRAPGIIMASVSPFGESGPYAGFSATSAIIYALGGYTYITGDPDREPVSGPENLPEYVAGAYAYAGVLAAVLARKGTGRGQRVEISELEGMAAAHQWTLTRYDYNGRVQERNGNRYNSLHPVTCYECSDGVIAASPSAPAQLRSMLQLLGREDLFDDPRFATNSARIDNADAFDAEVQPWFLARTRAQAVAECQDFRVPTAPALEMDELLAHEQLVARGYWQGSVHPVAGGLVLPGAPFRMPASPVAPSRAPLLSEHTEALRNEMATTKPVASVLPEATGAAILGGPPLTGVRVLDLTRVWSGPLATRILGDLGAEVIKVEHPSARGPRRTLPVDPRRGSFFPGDIPGDDPWNRSASFNKLNRNKMGLTLDLATPEGHEVFCGLVREADVVIENYSPRVMGNLGLSYEELCAINDQIILVSMPGYGLDGPMRDRVAYGTTLDAECGIASLMGYADRGPLRFGVAFPDPVAGIHAAGAILTAVLQRDRIGRGQQIDLSQFECAVTLMGDQVVGYQLTGQRPPRRGNRHRWMAPHGVFECRRPGDWLAIAVASDRQWREFAALAGRSELGADPRYASVVGRLAHEDEVEAIVREWLAKHDAHNAMLALQSHGIAAGEVLSAKGMHEDPHLRARDFFVTLDHPSAGTHDYPGLPLKFSGTPPVFLADAPRLGEHNKRILQALLDYDDARVSALEAAGVIADRPPV
jgi:crotonobetainyl-CoA:carnitine CoA-transferase CaiB-like acyl-CoA transferase